MGNSTLSSEEEALRQEVFTWYHKQALEMPPERLDQDILRLAQTHLAEINVSQIKSSVTPVWRRFPWALSSAASLVIVVGLVVLNRGQFEEEALAPAAVTMSAPMPAAHVVSKAAEGQQEAKMLRQMRVEDSSKQKAQREVVSAQANVTAEENLQAQSGSLPQVARILPQDDVTSIDNGDTAALMTSLMHLQELIEAKQIQQALALEQTLVKQYPALSKINTQVAADDTNAITKFKALQQQLHSVSK